MPVATCYSNLITSVARAYLASPCDYSLTMWRQISTLLAEDQKHWLLRGLNSSMMLGPKVTTNVCVYETRKKNAAGPSMRKRIDKIKAHEIEDV